MATDVAEIEQQSKEGFIRGLGLLDSTMIVAGSMIGSGIFIVSADIARQVADVAVARLSLEVTPLDVARGDDADMDVF